MSRDSPPFSASAFRRRAAVTLRAVPRRLRRVRSPELVDQTIPRDNTIGVQQKQREERPQPRPAERPRPVFGQDLQRTEYAKFHQALRA
jgi:hypothetical protein